MIKRGKIIAFLILLIAVNLTVVNASFKYYDEDIENNYLGGEVIQGKINISFTNENANSLFKSNFIGNITLLKLLELNDFSKEEDFKCSTLSCLPEYNTEENIVEIYLDKESVIGLKIEGNNIESISSIGFDIETNILESCSAPIIINLPGEEKRKLVGSSYIDKSCTVKNYGCFDKDAVSYSTVKIENADICENIKLNPAPAYRIGARIINSTKKGSLKMTLYDDNGGSISCTLPQQNLAEEDLDCIIEKGFLEQENVTVCIKDTASSQGTNYKIRSEVKNPVCGTSERDFEIFATPLGYNTTKISFNTKLYEKSYSDSLEGYLYDYLSNNYEQAENGISCKPCIIPISLSGLVQNLKFSNANLVFKDDGLTIDDSSYKNLYSLTTKPSTITSQQLLIDLEKANFLIPLTASDSKFKLFLNDNKIFEEDIIIKKSFDFSINPKFAFLGLETNFEVVTSYNISSAKWDFGDGVIQETKGKTIKHRYTEAKEYDLKVEIKRIDNTIAVKSFKIIAGNPKESANKLITDYKIRINDLTKEIKDFSPFAAEKIKSKINITSINNSLANLEKDFNSVNKEEDYLLIIDKLLDLNIPLDIKIGKRGTLPIGIGFDNMDLSYVEEVLGKEFSDTEQLEGIVITFNENYKTDIEFELFSAISNQGKEDLITKFKFNIEPRVGAEDAYLFINYPFDSIEFQNNYGQKKISEGSAVYIPISKEGKTLEFIIEDGIEVNELGSYLSPVIINLDEKIICLPGDEKCNIPFPWKKVIFWIFIDLAIILVIYIILQEWYKRYYEHYLFKNNYDLYNLINFIYNSRSSGLKDQEVRKKLKAVNWSAERINYAFNKIDGKRTGMWEIPLFKIFENRRVKRELEKRQNKALDIRFIKQPRF